jgi:hypothetical protein
MRAIVERRVSNNFPWYGGFFLMVFKTRLNKELENAVVLIYIKYQMRNPNYVRNLHQQTANWCTIGEVKTYSSKE